MFQNKYHHFSPAKSVLQIISLAMALILTHTNMLHAETNYPHQDQGTTTLRLDNYLFAGSNLPFMSLEDGQPEEVEFDLTDYYNDLEPPSQDGLLGRYSVLGEDTLYLIFPAVCVMGVIYMLPESVSNWDKDSITWGSGTNNWTHNTSNWVWDKDDFWINYIGHPYFGSAYYIHARHYGFSRIESVVFSFTTSAFYEFAIEGWAEPVSIQDLIFTPLLGWGLAELLLPIEHHIHKNKDKVLHSKILGGLSLFLIDPFGHIIHPLKRWTKSVFSDDAVVQLSPTIERQYQKDYTGRITSADQTYGLRLDIRW